MSKRTCGDCTMCCQGWLGGSVNGKTFYAGRPCHYVSCNGCSIYEDRPYDPCQSYTCAWLTDSNFLPEWFRPDTAGIICTWRKTTEDIPFLDIQECGQPLGAKFLNWLFHEYLNRGFNLRYKLDGGLNYIGQPDFVKSITSNPHQ